MSNLRPRLIDSHAHLHFDRFDEDYDDVLARAASAGIDAIVTIGTDLHNSQRARDLAHARGDVEIFAAAGVHPHEVDRFADEDWPALSALWRDPRVIAVGETGLDDYYDYGEPARQRVLFRRHLEASAAVALPVVIHVRDAFDDAFAIIEETGVPSGGVLHCFTGGPAESERALALGLHISIAGIVTFRTATALREAVAMIPDDRLLIETDAPFLSPVPHRGRRNEPSHVVHTARAVAELRGLDYPDLCASTHANTVRLFGLPIP